MTLLSSPRPILPTSKLPKNQPPLKKNGEKNESLVGQTIDKAKEVVGAKKD